MIVGGSCNLNDKINTSLANESETTVIELKNMKFNWKIETLISFGNRTNLLMNGFLSWHMCIKAFFKNNLVIDYNDLSLQQRIKKPDFFENIYDDQFSKLKIKIFYLQSRTVFVEQDIEKDTIIKLLKNIRVDKAAIISSKKMFDIIGQSKFYSRNNDSIHETNSQTRFRVNCSWICVNKHFTQDVCYRINSDKYKSCQIVCPIDQPMIISLNGKKVVIKNQDLVI